LPLQTPNEAAREHKKIVSIYKSPSRCLLHCWSRPQEIHKINPSSAPSPFNTMLTDLAGRISLVRTRPQDPRNSGTERSGAPHPMIRQQIWAAGQQAGPSQTSRVSCFRSKGARPVGPAELAPSAILWRLATKIKCAGETARRVLVLVCLGDQCIQYSTLYRAWLVGRLPHNTLLGSRVRCSLLPFRLVHVPKLGGGFRFSSRALFDGPAPARFVFVLF
jgi:hypothetical protein